MGTPNKIIAIITKIQLKHYHKDNQPNTKGSQSTHTRLSLLAFLLHKGTQTPIP